MTVLVIAPHQDDEVLGCGGTIRRLAERGEDVAVFSMCLKSFDHKVDRVEEYRAQCRQACKVLGARILKFGSFETEVFYRHFREIMAEVATMIQEVRPKLVLFPHYGDLHQDHRTTSEACGFALRTVGGTFVETAAMYEVGGSTGQLFREGFTPNLYVPLSEEWVKSKVEAMKCYDSELRENHPRSEVGIRLAAKMRGMEIGCEFAEAFVLHRGITRWLD